MIQTNALIAISWIPTRFTGGLHATQFSPSKYHPGLHSEQIVGDSQAAQASGQSTQVVC